MIAVVGLACRLPPEITTADEMWDVLAEGRTIAHAFDESRLQEKFRNSSAQDFTRTAALVNSVDLFSPQFFGISPREAKSLDPQQRLLLELAWEGLEDAAIAASSVRGTRGGVFIGLSSDDYAYLKLGCDRDELLDRY